MWGQASKRRKLPICGHMYVTSYKTLHTHAPPNYYSTKREKFLLSAKRDAGAERANYTETIYTVAPFSRIRINAVRGRHLSPRNSKFPCLAGHRAVTEFDRVALSAKLPLTLPVFLPARFLLFKQSSVIRPFENSTKNNDVRVPFTLSSGNVCI